MVVTVASKPWVNFETLLKAYNSTLKPKSFESCYKKHCTKSEFDLHKLLFYGLHFDANCITILSRNLQHKYKNWIFILLKQVKYSLQLNIRTWTNQITSKCVQRELDSLKLHDLKPFFWSWELWFNKVLQQHNFSTYVVKKFTHMHIHMLQLHNIRFVFKRLMTLWLFGRSFQQRGSMNISCCLPTITPK